MVGKLVERKQAEVNAMQGKQDHKVPESELFQRAGIKIKKVNSGYHGR